MAWTTYGTAPSFVFSETTVAIAKTLTTADLPEYTGEIRILGMRIELSTSAVAGSRQPRIQILTDDATEDVLFNFSLSEFNTISSSKNYEINCGAPFSGEVTFASAAGFGHNIPELRIAKGQKLKVLSAAGGDVDDSYVVHVRAESV